MKHHSPEKPREFGESEINRAGCGFEQFQTSKSIWQSPALAGELQGLHFQLQAGALGTAALLMDGLGPGSPKVLKILAANTPDSTFWTLPVQGTLVYGCHHPSFIF